MKTMIFTRGCILLFFFLLIGQVKGQNPDDVLFSVEDRPVTVDEFRYIYEKNNNNSADYSESSLREYLELYQNFKLKVFRAREMKLDTLPNLIKELAGYRKQLANSYLNDKEVTNNLVEEVLSRLDSEREVSHIFLPVNPKAPVNIQKQVKENIDKIHARLQKGEDFGKLAMTESLDEPSARNAGYIGYYVAPLPSGFYAFENAMYNTQIGQFSEPFKSKMGWHIVKVSSERPARGEMDIAHILIRYEKDNNNDLQKKATIDSIYNIVRNSPEQFETLAKSLSEDKNTANRGGVLGTMKINQYEKEFEDTAFALKNDGDISRPIQTKLGWHIIKRIRAKDFQNKDLLRKSMKAKLARDDRLELSRKALIDKIKKESGMQVDKRVVNTLLTKLDEDFYTYKWTVPELPEMDLVTFNDGTAHPLSEFTTYVKQNTRERLRYNAKDSELKDALNDFIEKFTDDAAIEYEENNLEKKYPAFKSLMREYEEGILLFEASKQEVWDKASQDTVGLRSYFTNNTDKYQWDQRAVIQRAIIKSDDKKTLGKIKKAALKKDLSAIQSKYASETVSMIIEDEQEIVNNANTKNTIPWKAGETLISENVDGSLSLTSVKQIKPAGPKTFDESRGYIIADYQDKLEKDWVAELKSRYKISLNEDILQKLIK